VIEAQEVFASGVAEHPQRLSILMLSDDETCCQMLSRRFEPHCIPDSLWFREHFYKWFQDHFKRIMWVQSEETIARGNVSSEWPSPNRSPIMGNSDWAQSDTKMCGKNATNVWNEICTIRKEWRGAEHSCSPLKGLSFDQGQLRFRMQLWMPKSIRSHLPCYHLCHVWELGPAIQEVKTFSWPHSWVKSRQSGRKTDTRNLRTGAWDQKADRSKTDSARFFFFWYPLSTVVMWTNSCSFPQREVHVSITHITISIESSSLKLHIPKPHFLDWKFLTFRIFKMLSRFQ
jgi:hypothetical protein